uniref:Uncharacterized protein n=2 Tax=Haptolina ericina TaxID=156174 RepID=A0A7S3F0P7_9EUKA|eukprot:CAMPEP_0181200260 /NCGR_PEP_ID=MMETSP1096-20121128/17661_1 /TAXON_ID=156174 ORGANISM="Chrysochromulina ericina, Strain CCMP281" /NCGR_SAMPLE_ID=MMETSP1096 /ASSEMBLY_ACC=CAM_ASM_000453 /LENGTH=195 /DNA_ID=CAMNT_0023290589 /DNA_START=28 /DNA_END=615 /DNA_ORIENTATION=-
MAEAFTPIPTPVYWSLWISTLVYTPLGLAYFFNKHVATFNAASLKTSQLGNAMVSTWQNMSGVGLMVLVYLCVDALMRGSITKLEIEIEMLTVTAYAGLVFKTTFPGKLAVIVPLTKPECWLSALLLTCCNGLVRWPCLLMSVINILSGLGYGFFMPFFEPFTMEQAIKEAKAYDAETGAKIEKFAAGSKASEQV